MVLPRHCPVPLPSWVAGLSACPDVTICGHASDQPFDEEDPEFNDTRQEGTLPLIFEVMSKFDRMRVFLVEPDRGLDWWQTLTSMSPLTVKTETLNPLCRALPVCTLGSSLTKLYFDQMENSWGDLQHLQQLRFDQSYLPPTLPTLLTLPQHFFTLRCYGVVLCIRVN
jgi:hypothetical protein